MLLVVEKVLLKCIFEEFLMDVHYWLILYGCYVCKVRMLECVCCIIADLCEYPARTATESAQV